MVPRFNPLDCPVCHNPTDWAASAPFGKRLSREAEAERLRADNRALRERLAEAEQFARVYRSRFEECDDRLRRATAELEPIRRSFALRFVRLLARLEWAMAPAGSRRRNLLHAARHGVGGLRRRAAALFHTAARRAPATEPALPPRISLDYGRLAGPGPAVLMVTHYGGGGTGRHVRDMAGGLEREGARVLLLCPADGGRLRLERFGDAGSGLVFDPKAEYYTLLTALPRLGCVHVHVQHLLGHPPETMRLVADLGLPYDVTIHDYHYACPRIHLHDHAGRYCGEPAAGACNACLVRNGDFLGERGGVTIDAWRRRHAGWLAGARRVFVPQAEVGRRMARYFPHVRFHERPHPEIDAPDHPIPPAPGPTESLGVALLGVLAAHKGAEVLTACARDAEARRLPLRFEVIGATLRPVHEWPANVAVTGEYREEEIFGLIRDRRVHCALFLSIVPETYSYTLSIAQAAGLYPLGFDLGAIGARIRESGWGEAFPATAAPDEINDRLLAAAARLRQGVVRPPRVVRRYESLSRDYYGIDLAAAPDAARGRAA